LDVPPVTHELIERLEAPLEAFGVARVEALARMAGNPLGLRIERFGGVVAPAALADPELDFVNRISGLRPTNAGRLGEILAFYGELGLRPWLEIAPGAELTLPAGTELLGFQSVLYGATGAATRPVPSVRETANVTATARLILEAFGVPSDRVDRHGAALAEATETSGGRFYVVEVDGRPVAAAILTAREGVGYLAMAATLPEFRGRGYQQALIAARIGAAAAAGCELIVATAEFGSASQRNIERGGLRIAYTKPVLRLRPAAADSA
jgi:GNAT superfamily N-acetyltransferase